jgi:hypothetical protein
MKGRKVSQETRDRISASLKARNSQNKETAGPSLFIECISTAAGDLRDLRGCLSIQAAPELQHVGTTALILRFSSIGLRNEAFELLRDIPEVLKVSLNAHTQLSHGAWVSGVSEA